MGRDLAVCLRVLLLVLVIVGGGAHGQELQAIPALSAHVTDTLGVLPEPQRLALENRLVRLEQEKGAQLAVLVVSSTQPEAIEAYALRAAEAWRLGRKGVDDGVLFLVAREDRRMRIEVGRGLEGAIPDAIAKRIIADVVTPHFKSGDFPGGIEAGVEAIAARVSGEALPAPAAGGAGSDVTFDSLSDVLVFGLLGVVIVGSVLRVILGRVLGATVLGGLAGVGGWMFSGTLLLGVVAGVVAFFFALALGSGGGGRGGPWVGGGGMGGFGRGGGGGGWSGGGGGFGGGGASGSW